jgi:twinkle protein
MAFTRTDSEFVRHCPCKACGSSDANALFTDGHTFCYACSAHVQGDGSASAAPPSNRKRMAEMIQGESAGLIKRKLTQETTKLFGYVIGEHRGTPVQAAPYYDADGNMVAQKVRFPDKDFTVVGDIKDAMPFGAQLWPRSGKKIVVTEGEIDAMTMSQVQGNKWPVVSIACGADAPEDANGNPLQGTKIRKYFAKHKEYFSGFDEVVLMFDNDPQGRFSSKVAAEVLGARARIADLPQRFKDPNEMLVAGETEALINAMWKAREYRPEGIIDMATLKDAVKQQPAFGLSLPLPGVSDLMYGVRLGEIIAVGAGTGIGKTDLFTQIIAHFMTEHQLPVGAFYMEQSPRETATRIAGKLAGKTFHIPDSGWTEADLDTAWDRLMNGGKCFLYDSFGINEWDVVKEKMEYLKNTAGVQYFFLDHLTALAAAEDDERTGLERIMSEMGGLVKKLNITIFLISHLATPEGKPHEEGGRVMIRHFKGSRSIGFWCHYMIGLERDQQHEDEKMRSITTLRFLKDRYTGRATGKCIYLGYEQETGTLYETQLPSEGEDAGADAYGFTDTAVPAPSIPLGSHVPSPDF